MIEVDKIVTISLTADIERQEQTKNNFYDWKKEKRSGKSKSCCWDRQGFC